MFEIVDHHVKEYFVCFKFLEKLIVLTIEARVLGVDFLDKILNKKVHLCLFIWRRIFEKLLNFHRKLFENLFLEYIFFVFIKIRIFFRIWLFKSLHSGVVNLSWMFDNWSKILRKLGITLFRLTFKRGLASIVALNFGKTVVY